jgi:hypothetical protein
MRTTTPPRRPPAAALPPVTALVLAVLVLAACGGDEAAPRRERPAAATTTAAAPAGTPFPTSDVTPLENGVTYTTRHFRTPLAITPAGGDWIAQVADRPGHLALELDVRRGFGWLAFHHVTRVFDPGRGGELPRDMVEGPVDFAEWLMTHPRLRVGEPEPVQALGLQGVAIDVRTRSQPPRVPDECGKIGSPCVPFFHDGFDDVMYGGRDRGRFLVLDDGGRQLVVELAAAPRSRAGRIMRDLEAQLARVRRG